MMFATVHCHICGKEMQGQPAVPVIWANHTALEHYMNEHAITDKWWDGVQPYRLEWDRASRTMDIYKAYDVTEKAEDDPGFDMVDKPEHYAKGTLECIDWIRYELTPEEYRGYLKGNVLKYIWRHEDKGKPVQDLRKATKYLSFLIDQLEREECEADIWLPGTKDAEKPEKPVKKTPDCLHDWGRDFTFVYTTYPAKYKWTCTKCGATIVSSNQPPREGFSHE